MPRSTADCIQAVTGLNPASDICHTTAQAVLDCLGTMAYQATGEGKQSFFAALRTANAQPTVFSLKLDFNGLGTWGHEFALQNSGRFVAYQSFVNCYSLQEWMAGQAKATMANVKYSPASQFYAHNMAGFVNKLEFAFPEAVAARDSDTAVQIALDLFGGSAIATHRLKTCTNQGYALTWSWKSRPIN